MKKITFIGAGSMVFTTNVVRDIATFPAFDDAELCLMDIDPHRLEGISRCVERIKNERGTHFTITQTTDREEGLKGADAVLYTVHNATTEILQADVEIPKKYGVDINIGDTRSISGIFMALRNIPLMLDICRDVERICPNAVVLNYTNPMAMLCKAMLTYTKADVTGLCHSVQGTSQMLAEWAGVDYADVTYTCAGINHLSFFTELKYKGEDLYPILKEKIKDPFYYKQEKVRNEMFKMFGYYVTESSGHNSEYTPWFRKRPDLIRRFCDPDGANWNPGEYAYVVKQRSNPKRFDEYVEEWIAAPLDKNRGSEYAAQILNARIGDLTPFTFNANLINEGSVENLPYDACVEIPVLATPEGYKRIYKGKLPPACAAFVGYTANIENLVVEAYEKRSKELVYQAVSLDPLCSAVLTLDEVRSMCDELFEINKEYLSDYQ